MEQHRIRVALELLEEHKDWGVKATMRLHVRNTRLSNLVILLANNSPPTTPVTVHSHVLTRNKATAVVHTIPTPVGDAEQCIRLITLRLFCIVFYQLFTVAVTALEVGGDAIITQIQKMMITMTKTKITPMRSKMIKKKAIQLFQQLLL